MVAEALQSSGTNRLLILDVFRGAAALAVLWHHVMKLHAEELSAWFTAEPISYRAAEFISMQNGRAVMLFFVLSGIAIRLAIREPLNTRVAIKLYASRRAWRILPLYWFSFAWTLALGLAAGALTASYEFETLAGNLLFLQTSSNARGVWFEPYGENGPYWSLSYEVFYYLLVPVIFASLGKRVSTIHHLTIWLSALALLVSLGAVGLGLILPSPPQAFLTLWLVWMLGFLIGDRFVAGKSQWIVLPIVAGPFVVQFGLALAGRSSDTLSLLVDGSAIAALVALGFQIGPRLASRQTIEEKQSIRWMVVIGSGSYALYLLHYPLLSFLQSQLRPNLTPATYWLILLVLLYLFCRYFCPWLERAFQRLRKAAMAYEG